MTDLVKLYNPANAASLTPEQLEGLQKLDSTQIKELAVAYPNMTMQRAFLLIVDTKDKLPIERQLPKLSTFENLWNLREKNGQRGWVPYSFKGTYKSKALPQRARRTEFLDLSDTELLSLPGFKKSGIVDKTMSDIFDNETPTVKIAFKKNPLDNAMKEINSLESIKPEFQKKMIQLPEQVKVTKIKKVPVKKTKSK